MLFTINVKTGTVQRAIARAAEAVPYTYYVGSEKDAEALSGSDLIEIFNTVVKVYRDLELREVNKFSDKTVAVRRVWGALVRVDALLKQEKAEAEVKAPVPASEPKTEKPVKAQKAPKEPKPVTDKVKKTMRLKDLSVPAVGRTVAVKPGTTQAFALELLSREGGIGVDDFIAAWNAQGYEHLSRTNMWSTLVYVLHTQKGYGIKRVDEVVSIVT